MVNPEQKQQPQPVGVKSVSPKNLLDIVAMPAPIFVNRFFLGTDPQSHTVRLTFAEEVAGTNELEEDQRVAMRSSIVMTAPSASALYGMLNALMQQLHNASQQVQVNVASQQAKERETLQ